MALLTEHKAGVEDLLARIDDIADELAETTEESERLSYLSPRALELLRGLGLYGIAVPREVGGLELSIIDQMRIISRLAEIDSAAAWNVMVSNNTAAFIGAYLPDEVVAGVFRDGVPPAAGVGPRWGEAVPVGGGYRVTGVFRMCSGAEHAEWFRFHTAVVVDGQPRSLFGVVPRADVRLLDNWDVLGLRGSGSPDYALDDVFVPEIMTIPEEVPLRGGPQFRQKDLPATAYEHAAVAIGLARRALRAAGTVLAGRAVQHDTAMNALGRASLRIEAVSTAAEIEFARVCDLLVDPDADADALSADNPAMAALATDVAIECVETAYRLAGAAAVYRPNVFERMLRDVHAASQHACVQDFHYTNAGRRIVDALR